MSDEPAVIPFEINDCALVGIATGRRAQSLREMRDILQDIHPGSIYYHFWGHLLRPTFDNPEYMNDFAGWAHGCLHDRRLAEQLGVIDAAEFDDLEALRQEVIDVIEERLDESEIVPWTQADRQFHFIRSQIVVFDTHAVIEDPRDLVDVIPTMSLGSIFYHFIDAGTREPRGTSDFVSWLTPAGEEYADLCAELNAIDPYFAPLIEVRQNLAEILNDYFGREPQ